MPLVILRVVEHNITKSIGLGLAAALIAAALFGLVSTIAKPILTTVNPFLLSSLVYLISAIFFTAIIALRNNTSSSSASRTSLQPKSSFHKRRYYYLIVITTS